MFCMLSKGAVSRLGLCSAAGASACLSSLSRRSERLWKEQREDRELHDGREQLDARSYRRKAGSQRFDCENKEAFAQRFDIGLVARLGREKRWEEALAAFQAAAGTPSAVLRASIVDALAKSGKLQFAEHFFNEMPLKTVPAYNSLITLKGRLGRLEEVEALLHDMRQQCLALTAVTYGSVITACARAGDVQAAIRTFEEMVSAGIAPNAVSCAATMSACARAGNQAQAAELLAKMRSWSIQPNIGHFTSVITSCAKAGDEVLATKVFREMQHECIKPDVVAYTSFISCFAGKDALLKAEAVREEMQEQAISPNSFFYSAMLNAARRSGSVQRFNELLADMDACGIPRTGQVELRVKQMQQALDRDRVESRKAETATTTVDSKSLGSPALPPGWKELLDPSSGRYYYWMESDPTGTVTWKRPSCQAAI